MGKTLANHSQSSQIADKIRHIVEERRAIMVKIRDNPGSINSDRLGFNR
jgi:hypothetical protein